MRAKPPLANPVNGVKTFPKLTLAALGAGAAAGVSEPHWIEVEGCKRLTHCLSPAMGFKLICSWLLCQQVIGDKGS